MNPLPLRAKLSEHLRRISQASAALLQRDLEVLIPQVCPFRIFPIRSPPRVDRAEATRKLSSRLTVFTKSPRVLCLFLPSGVLATGGIGVLALNEIIDYCSEKKTRIILFARLTGRALLRPCRF